MSRGKYLKGACTHCGGHLEYPAEAIGQTTGCPHCGQTTELMLATPPQEPSVPRKTIFWTAVAVVIMALGLAGAFAALKLSQRWASQNNHSATPPPPTNSAPPPPEDPFAKVAFRVGEASLERVEGSRLVYAVGEIVNLADRQRFGVRVELDLFDAGGRKVGTAKDYQAVIEPRAAWKFRAPVVEPKAVSAKLSAVKED